MAKNNHIERDFNRKPYVRTKGDFYRDMMGAVTQKAIDDIDKAKHSELLKPYLVGSDHGPEGFRGMEHYHPINFRPPYRGVTVDANPTSDRITDTGLDPCAGDRTLRLTVDGNFSVFNNIDCGETAILNIEGGIPPFRDPVISGQGTISFSTALDSFIYEAPKCGCDCKNSNDSILLQDFCGGTPSTIMRVRCKEVTLEADDPSLDWQEISHDCRRAGGAGGCDDPDCIQCEVIWDNIVVEEIVNNQKIVWFGFFGYFNNPCSTFDTDRPDCLATNPSPGAGCDTGCDTGIGWQWIDKFVYEHSCEDVTVQDSCTIIDCGVVSCTGTTWGCN